MSRKKIENALKENESANNKQNVLYLRILVMICNEHSQFFEGTNTDNFIGVFPCEFSHFVAL